MNKAFVKETEDPQDLCPSCGSQGTVVLRSTLRNQLPPELQDRFSDSAFFCPLASCGVVYFDAFERRISVEEFPAAPYPKDIDAPICPCFGFTCDEIEADIADGGVTRVREHLERAKSELARCETMAVDGRSCVAAVQRYFMQRRGLS